MTDRRKLTSAYHAACAKAGAGGRCQMIMITTAPSKAVERQHHVVGEFLELVTGSLGQRDIKALTGSMVPIGCHFPQRIALVRSKGQPFPGSLKRRLQRAVIHMAAIKHVTRKSDARGCLEQLFPKVRIDALMRPQPISDRFVKSSAHSRYGQQKRDDDQPFFLRHFCGIPLRFSDHQLCHFPSFFVEVDR